MLNPVDDSIKLSPRPAKQEIVKNSVTYLARAVHRRPSVYEVSSDNDVEYPGT